MRRQFLYIVFLALVAGCSIESSTAERPTEEMLAAKAGEEYRDLTPDGAWCWFQDPRAVYYRGNHSRTYAGWVDSSGNISVRHYDHEKNELGPVFVLRESLLHNGRADDHDAPSFLVLPDGRIQAFYSPHSANPMWYRVNERPENIATWGPEHELGTNTGDGGWGLTYPNPYRLDDEDRIFLFWRGGSGKPSYSISTDGLQWSCARMLILGSGRRPYVKYTSNGRNKIHIAFTDGHPHRELSNSIYYANYCQDTVWRTPEGGFIKTMDELPIVPSEAEMVYDGSTKGRAWIWDIAVDSEGWPVMVFSVMPEKNKHYYHYACWDGKKWLENQITFAGPWFPQTSPGKTETEPFYSGGVVLDHRDPSTVYLSRQVDGVFEIERWYTADSGGNWNSEPITRGSKRDNVRPLVSRASPGEPAVLFWMHGDYVHYTQFSTGIKMLTLKNE